MDQTQKLLQSVVENARTGLDACEQLLKKVDDARMRDELMTERAEYQGFVQNAERALFAAGARPHAKNPASRMGMWMGIQMETLTDNSPTHIAEMLIQGATMGVVEMTKDRAACSDASPEALKLADDFIARQQQAIDSLKLQLTAEPEKQKSR